MPDEEVKPNSFCLSGGDSGSSYLNMSAHSPEDLLEWMIAISDCLSRISLKSSEQQSGKENVIAGSVAAMDNNGPSDLVKEIEHQIQLESLEHWNVVLASGLANDVQSESRLDVVITGNTNG